MMVDLFKVEESSGGGGGELSEVPTTGGCPLLGVPTYSAYGELAQCPFFCGTKSREDRLQGSRNIDIPILSSLIQESDLFGRSPNTTWHWVAFVWHPVSC
jgi:hypothetical protein